MAQQPDEQQTPKTKQGAEKTHAAEAKPGANAAKPEATAPKHRGARNEPAASKAQKPESTPKSAASSGYWDERLRSTGRQCDAWRGAAQERDEGAGRKREDITECYSSSGGIGKCSSISFVSQPAKGAG